MDTNKNRPTVDKNIVFGKIIKAFTILLFLNCLNPCVLVHPRLASKEQVKMFLNSKTCVVVGNNSISYRVLINNAVQKYWKITKYEFIDQQEFEKRRSDPKYSFLIILKEFFDKDSEGVSYNYLNLVLGDTAKDISDMPVLCSIPISYADDSNVDYGYALPSIVKFMQGHVKNVENKHLLISLLGLRYYNDKLKLDDKVLLLNKDALSENANTPEKIMTHYPHSIKLLSINEIQKILDTNQANTVFNLHVGPSPGAGAAKCFEMIMDTDGNLYYYNYRKITNIDKDGFNLSNFDDIK